MAFDELIFFLLFFFAFSLWWKNKGLILILILILVLILTGNYSASSGE